MPCSLQICYKYTRHIVLLPTYGCFSHTESHISHVHITHTRAHTHTHTRTCTRTHTCIHTHAHTHSRICVHFLLLITISIFRYSSCELGVGETVCTHIVNTHRYMYLINCSNKIEKVCLLYFALAHQRHRQCFIHHTVLKIKGKYCILITLVLYC